MISQIQSVTSQWIGLSEFIIIVCNFCFFIFRLLLHYCRLFFTTLTSNTSPDKNLCLGASGPCENFIETNQVTFIIIIFIETEINFLDVWCGHLNMIAWGEANTRAAIQAPITISLRRGNLSRFHWLHQRE